MYNLHAAGLTQTNLYLLDAFHRKQLRMVRYIHYPAKVSNKAPILIMLLYELWKRFVYTLRLPLLSPPQLSMELVRVHYVLHYRFH